MHTAEPAPATGWVLEGYLEGTRNLVVTPISAFPFRIGRKATGGLRLPSSGVSSRHAELDHDGQQLWLRDLNSTNGTYVNRQRVRGKVSVKDGDVLHFATTEFVLRLQGDEDLDEQTVHRTIEDLPHRIGYRELVGRMIQQRAVRAVFQPIVKLNRTRDVHGWEALGRGALEGLPASPAVLLDEAARCGQATALSDLFRQQAMADANAFGTHPVIFLNCHPDELAAADRLIGRLAGLRALAPRARMVLEIHEKAVTDVGRMRSLVQALEELGIAAAYDDFGAGQARLLELVDATPAYVKFDKAWTRGLGGSDTARHARMLRTLVDVVLEMGIAPLCEGIETEDQVTACTDLGFIYGQGWAFGRPEPAPTRRF
ncbi:MAG: EAL domain-containing protein [Alphaproteobacteria bacterium]|nr:EAL domain-containing protein [Alphaproteobacteria bacterium]